MSEQDIEEACNTNSVYRGGKNHQMHRFWRPAAAALPERAVFGKGSRYWNFVDDIERLSSLSLTA